MTPETKVKNKFISTIKPYTYENGGPIYLQRRDPSSPTYIEGSADVFLVINGIHIEVEFKRPTGGSQSPAQQRWARICEQIGCPYYLINDADEAFVILDKYAQIKK